MARNFSRPKIALIGAGQIGGNLALLCAQRDLGDVVLFDLNGDAAKGKALDLRQMGAADGFGGSIVGSQTWADVAGADVVIVTAGVPRKPGMSRDDLLDTNVKVMKEVAEALKIHCPDAFVIVVSNPLDAMVYTVKKVTGFAKERVVGMAGVLDTSRFATFVAEALHVSVLDVQALILGGHGDDMVPVVPFCTVGGVPLTQLMGEAQIAALVERTRKGGGEIVNLLKTGSAYFAPAASAVLMAESYLRDGRRVVAAAAQLDGQYGLHDLFVGVPVVIGKGGVEKILTVTLGPADQAALELSASHVRDLVNEANKRLG